MATTITLQKTPYIYNKETKTFSFSEKHVNFATEYILINEKTGKSLTFNFVKSTGPEFDPKTKWIYANKIGIIMEVCNDKEITKMNRKNYYQAKVK